MPPFKIIDQIPQFKYVGDLATRLKTEGCQRCSLGFQKEINGCCVFRGNPDMRRMIIGEAPGKEEDATQYPFTGPAGKLMDKIFAAVGLDTNEHFYVTNVVKCRPYLPKGSGKENFTPKVEQQKLCRPFLDQEINLIAPKLVVLLGKVAVDNVLPHLKREPMRALRGMYLEREGITYFIMLHPAAILHAQSDPELEAHYKEKTWEDIQNLKKIMMERHL